MSWEHSNNMNSTKDLGNNETVNLGVVPQADGSFLAMTYTKSKTFKTRNGADKWFRRYMASANLQAEMG